MMSMCDVKACFAGRGCGVVLSRSAVVCSTVPVCSAVDGAVTGPPWLSRADAPRPMLADIWYVVLWLFCRPINQCRMASRQAHYCMDRGNQEVCVPGQAYELVGYASSSSVLPVSLVL